MFTLIESHLEWLELPGGVKLIQQGSTGDSLFILISGRLQAFVKDAQGRLKRVGEITRGETVGEMALFTGEPRTASIFAARDSVLVKLTKAAFEEVISHQPHIVMNITRLLVERLTRQIKDAPAPYRIVNLALLAISPGLSTQRFARTLSLALEKHGKVLMLDSKLINEIFQDDTIAHAEPNQHEKYRHLAAWLDEQEAKHDFIIYAADEAYSGWTKRSLRQADEVFLLADPAASPQVTPIETKLLFSQNALTRAYKSLVLVQEKNTSLPTGSQHWHEERNLKGLYHIRRGDSKSFSRLARIVAGIPTGLVLAGGGARGLAHIGVFKALHEGNIPIDMVGGTSIGAVIASFIAHDMSYDEIYSLTKKEFLKNPTNDYDFLPIISILKGRKLERVLDLHLGNKFIEDLWLPFYCISSNLSRAQAKKHRRGILKNAIRASISLPGIFPPVLNENDLLIDGSIFNNLPVDVMQELGAGKIIAVDLSGERDFQMPDNRLPSSWELLKDRTLGRKNRKYNIPTLMSTIIQATTLHSDYKTDQLKQQVDLFFNPDVKDFGLMEWSSFDKIVDEGYRHANELLAKSDFRL